MDHEILQHGNGRYVLVSTCVLMFCNNTGSLAVESLRFLVIGDMGGLPTYPYVTSVELGTSEEMATIADKYGVSFIMELGDNFYYDGVKTVDDPRFKVRLSHSTELIVSLG